MRNIYPGGLKLRDHHGNLPIHYLLSEDFSKSKFALLDIVADDEYKCLSKKDGEGAASRDVTFAANVDLALIVETVKDSDDSINVLRMSRMRSITIR